MSTKNIVSIGLEYTALVNVEMEVPAGEDPVEFAIRLLKEAGCDLPTIARSPAVTKVSGVLCNYAAVGGAPGSFPEDALSMIPERLRQDAMEVGALVSAALARPGVDEGVRQFNEAFALRAVSADQAAAATKH